LNKQFDYVHVRCNTVEATTTKLNSFTVEIFAGKMYLLHEKATQMMLIMVYENAQGDIYRHTDMSGHKICTL